MMRFHTLVSSVGGIGYVGKGGGTLAAIVYCIIWYLLPAGYVNSYWQVAITLLVILLGTWSANEVEPAWGKDSSKVVMDEVAGMAIALWFVPQQPAWLLLSLVAFRCFDIFKPMGIRKAESLPGGWGVMADDVLAGVYALVLVHAVIMITQKFG